MEVIDFDERYMGFVATCTHGTSNRLDEVAAVRAGWIRNNLDRGLKIKIAVAEGRPLGFAHCMPIELGAGEIGGRDLTLLPCLTLAYDRVYSGRTGSGAGKALVKAVEDEAIQSTKGVVVPCFDHDFWFMPYAFFKKLGYREADRRGQAVAALKTFEDVEGPRFLPFNHQGKRVPGRVVVDAFWNPMCPTLIEEIRNIRKVCAEFGDEVELNAVNTGDPRQRVRYPVARALFVNGTRVVFDDVGAPDAIRAAIRREQQRT